METQVCSRSWCTGIPLITSVHTVALDPRVDLFAGSVAGTNSSQTDHSIELSGYMYRYRCPHSWVPIRHWSVSANRIPCHSYVVADIFHLRIVVKVRLQNPEFASRYNSVWHAFTTIVRKERVQGLFRGITSPLVRHPSLAHQLPKFAHIQLDGPTI